MPNLKKMEKTMISIQIPPEIMAQMDLDADQTGMGPYPALAVIEKMDELLSMEQRLAVMEREGCCKGGKRNKDCKAFGKEHAGKPLAEKLALLPNVEYMMAPRLNDDGTLSVTMSGHQNGVHKGKTTCSCGAVKKIKQPFTVSSTWCGCCAGHFLYHYQNALNVKLRLKEINSSPLDTNGEEPCSFTFEIIG